MRKLDTERTSQEVDAVHVFACGIGFIFVVVFDETEASRVKRNPYVTGFTKSLEFLFDVFALDLVVQITDINFILVFGHL